jgi:SlyX protein
LTNESEERFLALETRSAHQERMLGELNEVVIEQQRRIERLEAELQRTREQLLSVAASPVKDASEESPPPHY